jgi:hypothetical protein
VLLDYVALKRAGQDSQAKGLLANESARFFRGAVDEQLLLLLFVERIDTYPYKVSKNADDESKARFFSAELLLAQGQADAAREDLWESVTLERKDSIYVAAAKIELERMSARALP